MTVSELIEKLKKFPPDWPAYVQAEGVGEAKDVWPSSSGPNEPDDSVVISE